MRWFTLLISFATIVLAQINVSSLPPCSVSCFATAIEASGCGLTDYVCQCTTGKQALVASLSPCIEKACSPADQEVAALGALAICEAALTTSSSSVATATGTAASSTKTNGAPVMNGDIIIAGAGILAALIL